MTFNVAYFESVKMRYFVIATTALLLQLVHVSPCPAEEPRDLLLRTRAELALNLRDLSLLRKGMPDKDRQFCDVIIMRTQPCFFRVDSIIRMTQMLDLVESSENKQKGTELIADSLEKLISQIDEDAPMISLASALGETNKDSMVEVCRQITDNLDKIKKTLSPLLVDFNSRVVSPARESTTTEAERGKAISR